MRSRKFSGVQPAALLEENKRPSGFSNGNAAVTSFPKSFSTRNAPCSFDCENVGGSSRIASNFRCFLVNRRSQSNTSPKIKSCSVGSSLFRTRFRLPQSRYFFDRSRLVVRAPAFAAQTEKPQV